MKQSTVILAALLLWACNNPIKKSAAGATDSAATSTVVAALPDNKAAATEITVTLTGGANAGTYTASSTEPTCSEGMAGEKSFGNQYSDGGKKDNELSSLQLIINDKDAAKSGTDKFYISVIIGKLMDGKRYFINGGVDFEGLTDKGGNGKATFTEAGGTKIVAVEGKTAAGVGISATIKCNNVVRN